VKLGTLKKVSHRLSVFERKILSKIFGPTKEDGGDWRTKINRELEELIKHRNILSDVKLKD
jgi:uncharacterized membrane protein